MQPNPSAFFVFDYPPHKDTFAFELRDPEKIEEARRIIAGAPDNGTHVGGLIVKQPAPFNRPWSYHLAPESIYFFEWAMEVCDAGIKYVDDHLDEVGGSFLPGNRWCPWGSRLLDEVCPEEALEQEA